MSKTLTEAKITMREQRKKLVAGVHWRGIDPDVHLGYRKGLRGGKWLVRWYGGAGQGYQQQTFATADDEFGEGTLDYNAAVKAARQFVETERRNARAAAEGPVLKVRDAVEAYATMRDARDGARARREKRSDARSRLERYVIGHPARGRRKEVPPAPIADVALCDLSEADLLKWREALPDSLKWATKRRLINDLKAALNAGYSGNRSKLPTTLPATIKHGLSAIDVDADDAEPVARENQILTDAQVSGLISAARTIDDEQGWDGDLFRLVVVLAATGARFSQVRRLRVRDVQRDSARLMVPDSRKGRGGKKGSTPIPVGADVLEALLPAVTGRPKDAPLLERWRKVQVAGTIRWERTGRGPWQAASELIRPWTAIRAAASLPGVIPYALRHSSIVRGIRANLPIRLVAALHDTSVVMIERHYGRWIADGLDELAARAIVPLVRQQPSNVVQFSQA
jgi:integrase